MMNDSRYTPPLYELMVFNCPYCKEYVFQHWSSKYNNFDCILSPISIRLSECSECKKSCLWLDEKLVVPENHEMPLPNRDLPDDIKELYNEAAYTAQRSPRAASLLLRFALEELLWEFGGKGNNNYERIKNFMNKTNPPPEIEEALHTVRSVGNYAAHSRVINFNKTPGIVRYVFHYINYIAEETLTKARIKKERLKKNTIE